MEFNSKHSSEIKNKKRKTKEVLSAISMAAAIIYLLLLAVVTVAATGVDLENITSGEIRSDIVGTISVEEATQTTEIATSTTTTMVATATTTTTSSTTTTTTESTTTTTTTKETTTTTKQTTTVPVVETTTANTTTEVVVYYNEEEETESYDDSNSNGNMTYLGNLRITGYVATGSPTASGDMPYVGGIAMSRSYGLPYGTTIYIEGLGYYTLNDTGCATGVVDVFCNSVSECYALTSYADVYVVN